MTDITPQPTVAAPKTKVVYIDHLKVILTVLVILHHTFITYGAPGGWYYFQKTTNEIAKIPMTMFVAANQSFFMGFFFFLSAYFVWPSYEKKGASKFIKDRLIRLGVPLVFYSLVLGPFMNYLVYYFGKGRHISFLQYLGGYDDWIDFGVLWFVLALLVFTSLYALWRAIIGKRDNKPIASPSFVRIMLFAIALGLASFLVRLVFPIGWVMKYTGFQFGFFPQYVALFIAGILASKYKWLDGITLKMGKRGLLIAILMVVLVFPLFYVFLTIFKFPSNWFSGGWHWPALMYAMWDQLTGITACVALIGIGKEKLNRESALWGKLSRCTFAVYIFHPLVVISVALAISGLNIEPYIKLIFAAPVIVILSFMLGRLIVSIPGVNKIV